MNATKTDSRFFPGYFWVSETKDGKHGLCFKGNTAEEAGQAFMSRIPYYARKTAVVWVFASAESAPVEVKAN